jgi:hypothetical protein
MRTKVKLPLLIVTDLYGLQDLDEYKNDLALLKKGETTLTPMHVRLPNIPILALLLKTSTLTQTEKCEDLQSFPLPRAVSPFGLSIIGVPRDAGCK